MTREQLNAITNGDNVPICKSGNINLESSIVLKVILYIPQLTNSLITIQKLTKDFNCLVIFFSSYCVFQDLPQGRQF